MRRGVKAKRPPQRILRRRHVRQIIRRRAIAARRLVADPSGLGWMEIWLSS